MRLGIDFGTCFSSAAFMIGDVLHLIKDPMSHSFSVPSNVFATSQGQVLVGNGADNMRRRDPMRYRRELKRDIGKTEPLLLGGTPYLPVDLVAHILSKLKRDADEMLVSMGMQPFTGAVLTVPAASNEHRRAMMLQAAVSAGFVAEEMTLLEEPVAAALHYTRQTGVREGEILLIYDLGGGTFDTALVQKRGSDFEHLALPTGIEQCGGVDFDRAIYNDLVRRHQELQNLLNPEHSDEVALLTRIMVGEECVKLKHQLSEVEEAEVPIIVPGLGSIIHHHLTREAFDRMIDPTIRETIACCRSMLQKSAVQWEQIDRVVLVGGSCRIPYIRQVIEREFQRPVFVAPDLDLIVCQGTALYAAQHEIYVVSSTEGEGDYATIGAALQQAKSRSSIVVRPGTYRESVVLDKEIEIVGVGQRDAIILESVSEPCLTMRYLTDAPAVVRGLTLRQLPSSAAARSNTSRSTARRTATSSPAATRRSTAQATAQSEQGIVIIEQGHIVLRDCAVDAEIRGIWVVGAKSKITAQDCQITARKHASIAIRNGGQGSIENCDIFETVAPGVEIADAPSTATLRDCRLHDGKSLGVHISSGAQALIKGCDIFANASVQVQISHLNSKATIQGGQIHDGMGTGITIIQGGHAVIEHCDVFRNASAQIHTSEKGSLVTIQGGRIHEGGEKGIAILQQGQASIENCDIFGNAGDGVSIGKEGELLNMQRCQIHDGQSLGIAIRGKSSAAIVECDIFRNAGPGIKVMDEGSRASITHCSIYEGKYAGIAICGKGHGILEGCKIVRNTGPGVRIGDSGTQAKIRESQVSDGNAVGVLIEDEGTGIIEASTIEMNIVDVYVEPGSQIVYQEISQKDLATVVAETAEPIRRRSKRRY